MTDLARSVEAHKALSLWVAACEVPVVLSVCRVCVGTRGWFSESGTVPAPQGLRS